jgi:hypothetical protein
MLLRMLIRRLVRCGVGDVIVHTVGAAQMRSFSD